MTFEQSSFYNKIYTDLPTTTGDNMFTFLTEPKLIVPTTISDDSTLSVCSTSTYSMTPTSSSSNNIDYQVWQSPCQSDYLGLTAFDNHSTDFCVGDILDPNCQQQQSSSFITSPAMTHHSSMMDSLSIQQQQQQHLSPLSSQYSDYWVSPLTPSMDSMDYYNNNTTNNNNNNYIMEQQDMMITPYLLNTPSPSLSSSPLLTTTNNHHLENLTPPLMDTNNYMNHHSYQQQQTPSIKKKCKKIHYCPHCNHTSNRANNMKEHILTHDPNRPKLFCCHLCSKSFARKHDMKRHTKSHSKPSKKSIKRISNN